MNRVLMCFLFLLLTPPAKADIAADNLTRRGVEVFTEAYRDWNGDEFHKALGLFQDACTNTSPAAINYYWLGTGAFHCALYTLGEGDDHAHKATARKYLDEAVEALQKAVALDSSHAESHALLGTIYGMEIGENWMRAVWLGPKLQKEMQFATAHGTNDARVMYLWGTSQFYCASRESSRREALKTLLEAETLFDAEAKSAAAPLEPRWGRDSCLTFIGACYEKLNQPKEAATYYRKALVLHPEDGLARAGLARVTRNNP